MQRVKRGVTIKVENSTIDPAAEAYRPTDDDGMIYMIHGRN